MINFIKSDLYRIFKGKAIYICIGIIILLSCISVVLMQPGTIGITTGEMTESEYNLNNELNRAKSISEFRSIMKREGAFILDKKILGNNINLYYIFIVIIVISITTDFSNKSIKNSLSSAISRKKYYLSKLTISLLLCTILILFNNYLGYFMNYLINGKGFYSTFTEITKVTFIQLPLMYGIISMLVAFGFILRKTSIFNTVAIPLIMLFQVVCSGLISIFKIKPEFYMNYELQLALLKLADNPTNKYIISCLTLGIIYIVLFNLIGYNSFKKAEIK